MAAFNYQALDKSGKETKGVMEGDSSRQIRERLRTQGLTPLMVKEVKEKQNDQDAKKWQWRKTKMSVGELALVTRQMASLINAGMPVEEMLLAVSEQTETPATKSLILEVRARVLEGHALAVGLAEYPDAFPEVYRASVAAGEQSGHLDMILSQLADYTEKQQRMRQKIQQALIYPTIMTVVAVLIISFLLTFVVPKMIMVFSDTGQELPFITQFLIAISEGVKSYGLWILAALVIGFYAFKQAMKVPQFRERVHQFLLKIPLIGSTIKAVNTARFSRTFGILSSAGVSVLEAMRIASALVINIPIHQALNEAVSKVREGVHINQALKATQYFPPMSVHLIASGESSGQLDDMLERAADNQDRAVSMLIENLLSLFEPMMILVMGGIVLFIVLAILLPVFAMNQFVG